MAISPPLQAEQAQPAEVSHFPWETSPEVLAKAQAYIAAGQARSFLGKVDEFLEAVLRPQLLRSLRAKTKQKANLAEFHVCPDLIGITYRPEPPGFLSTLFANVLPPQWVVVLLTWFSNLIALGAGCFVICVVVVIMMLVLGPVLAILAIVLLIVSAAVANRLYEAWSRSNLDRIAQRIQSDPTSSYAIKQMYKRAGWMRWRTGIGHGQSGAVMTERFWQRGEVVQLVRVDLQSRLSPRNFLFIVMDRPLPPTAGAQGIGIVLVWDRIFRPTRRVYVIDLEGGSTAADAAGSAAAHALGVRLQHAQFGLLALTINDP
jgi:hypothetical protein